MQLDENFKMVVVSGTLSSENLTLICLCCSSVIKYKSSSTWQHDHRFRFPAAFKANTLKSTVAFERDFIEWSEQCFRSCEEKKAFFPSLFKLLKHVLLTQHKLFQSSYSRINL